MSYATDPILRTLRAERDRLWATHVRHATPASWTAFALAGQAVRRRILTLTV